MPKWLDFLPQDMDVTVVNRPLALLVMLVSLAGPSLAGEPTPAQRSNRANTNGQSQANKARPITVRESSRKPSNSNNGQLIGAGVRRTSTNGSNSNGGVQKASAVTRGPVVRASSQVVDEGVVYESSGDDYVVEEGMVGSGGGPLGHACMSAQRLPGSCP